jgi:hypothetical protein
MAERPTAGYDIEFDTDGVVGILQEFDVTYEGDSEDISGTGDTQNGIIRQNSKPVDVGSTITFSGKLDETAAGFDNFDTAMENRTESSKIKLLKDGDGWEYTGHSETYSKSMSRSEAVWNFSCTFVVNSESDVTS